MKKPNRRRDILLQRKREKERMRKQTKLHRDVDYEGPFAEQSASVLKRMLNYFNKKAPEEKAVLDRRERRAIKQGNR